MTRPVEYLTYLAACGAALSAWGYLLGPRRRRAWALCLVAGAGLVGYAIAGAVGTGSLLILRPVIGTVSFAAVVAGFLVILFGPAEATFIARSDGRLIPPVLLRQPWRDRRHHAVVTVSGASMLVVTMLGAVALFVDDSPTGYRQLYGTVDDLCDLPILRTLNRWDERLEAVAEDQESWTLPDLRRPETPGTTMYCHMVVEGTEDVDAVAVGVFVFHSEVADAEERFLEAVHLTGMRQPTTIETSQWTELVMDRRSEDIEYLTMAGWHGNLAVVVEFVWPAEIAEWGDPQDLTLNLTALVYDTLRRRA